MTEGTKSYFIGCHQFLLHPLCVAVAWRLEYKQWPKWWEVICIFLHDVGVCGRQYVSDDNAKIGHYRLGANVAGCLFRRFKLYHLALKSLFLIMGHCPKESGWPMSKLFRADKRSWLVAPTIWLWWNYWVEFSDEKSNWTKPPLWKKLVEENLQKKAPLGSHELFIKYSSRGRDVYPMG